MMIKKLNHVAIAVPDLRRAGELYRTVFGAQVSPPEDLPEHGVSVVFVQLENTRLELLQPLGDESPIARFLHKNPAGGIHHLCYEVEDIQSAAAALERDGMRILGDGRPRIGAHGKPVLFLHPGDALGTLIELEQA